MQYTEVFICYCCKDLYLCVFRVESVKVTSARLCQDQMAFGACCAVELIGVNVL